MSVTLMHPPASLTPALREQDLVESARFKASHGGGADQFITREEVCALLARIDRFEEHLAATDSSVDVALLGTVS